MRNGRGSVPAWKPDLLVIAGPTGSGKTDLAHAVALARAGEIVSADAFAVYREARVGNPCHEKLQYAATRIDRGYANRTMSSCRMPCSARASVHH